MKKLVYLLSILLCASNIFGKDFGKGFAWGSLFGATSGVIASRYQPHEKPSLYVVHHEPRPQPNVYMVPQTVPIQPQVVYYPQQAIKETHIFKNEPKCEIEARQLELQIIKEQNRKKELALKEKELDIQIFKLKQV